MDLDPPHLTRICYPHPVGVYVDVKALPSHTGYTQCMMECHFGRDAVNVVRDGEILLSGSRMQF
jgi:hypothetical protein